VGGIRNLVFMAVIAALSLAGCASERMAAGPMPTTVTAPSPDKATIVFARPSILGYAIQSSVFDISSEPPILVGIVSSRTKIAYAVDPGTRRFMVIGETADFMDANLVGGKIYFVRVSPRMSVWKARFSLDPVKKSEAASDLAGDLKNAGWVENTPASLQWAQSNMTSIQEKKADSFARWQAGADKATLNVEDGL
jgi:hypothetical protein